MLFVKEFKFLSMDLARVKWRLSIWFIVLLLCITSLVRQATPIEGALGFPQSFELFFSPLTFHFTILPLFLIFVSFGLIPFFEPLRLIRYRKREQVYAALLIRVFSIALLFTFIYLLGGIIISGVFSGRWDNVWLTEEGVPYLVFGKKISLQEYFGTTWMFTRYVITSILLFNVLGVFITICYVLISRYIYSFVIVSAMVLLDRMLLSYYGTSVLVEKMSLELDKWLMPETFQITLYFFGGMWVTMGAILYKLIKIKDYVSSYKADNGQDS